jgi:hypothetical protein
MRKNESLSFEHPKDKMLKLKHMPNKKIELFFTQKLAVLPRILCRI